MLITAEVARKQVADKKSNKITNYHIRELRGFEKAINKASKKGEICITTTRISDIAKAELEKNGFKVHLRSNYDMEWYIISWNETT